LATNEIAQTGLSSLPPVIYYSEQLFSGNSDTIRRTDWSHYGRVWRQMSQGADVREPIKTVS